MPNPHVLSYLFTNTIELKTHLTLKIDSAEAFS